MRPCHAGQQQLCTDGCLVMGFWLGNPCLQHAQVVNAFPCLHRRRVGACKLCTEPVLNSVNSH